MTDPVADMLTRIRNALRNRSLHVSMPSSALKLGVAEVLKREGYIQSFELVEGRPRNTLKLSLKYSGDGQTVISTLRRVSKPGCRVYRKAADLKPLMSGLGIYILSTSKGVMSDRECRAGKLGGEVLCSVW